MVRRSVRPTEGTTVLCCRVCPNRPLSSFIYRSKRTVIGEDANPCQSKTPMSRKPLLRLDRPLSNNSGAFSSVKAAANHSVFLLLAVQ